MHSRWKLDSTCNIVLCLARGYLSRDSRSCLTFVGHDVCDVLIATASLWEQPRMCFLKFAVQNKMWSPTLAIVPEEGRPILLIHSMIMLSVLRFRASNSLITASSRYFLDSPDHSGMSKAESCFCALRARARRSYSVSQVVRALRTTC